MNYLLIDFEYNKTNEQYLNLVCASVYDSVSNKVTNYWLLNNKNHFSMLKLELLSKRSTHTLICFNASAEARALISLGINPRNHMWIDLYIEFRQVVNCNDNLLRGEYLDTNGNQYLFDDNKFYDKLPQNAGYGLVAAIFKMLKINIGTKHKKEMQSLIIEGNNLEDHRKEILEYCESDIKYLGDLLFAIIDEYKRLGIYKLEDLLIRGKDAVNSAFIENIGVPVNREWLNNLIYNLPILIKSLQLDLNNLSKTNFNFEFINTEVKKMDSGYFKERQKSIREYFETNFPNVLPKTDKGNTQIGVDELERAFGEYHTGDDLDSFGKIFLAYKTILKSLSGFKSDKRHPLISDVVSSESRIHSFQGPFGTKTSRFAPPSRYFLFSKQAWVRSLVYSNNKIIVGFDYSSEEFLIAALLSEDENMLDAYSSGDPYLYFAKLSGALPDSSDGKNPEDKKIRNRFKSTVLGILYGMGVNLLHTKLIRDTKDTSITYEDALKLRNMFEDIFRGYIDWRSNLEDEYLSCGYLKLLNYPWYYFSNVQYQLNDWGNEYLCNGQTLRNFPVQGMGAVIIRKVIDMLLDENFKIIFSHHDAIYVELDYFDESKITRIGRIMKNAFRICFDNNKNANIRLDGKCWGGGLTDSLIELTNIGGVKTMPVYIRDGASEEYAQYSRYFNKLQ